MSKIKRQMAIHFTDGSKLRIAFPKQVEGAMVASKVQEAINADKLAFEADGALFIVPMANVKYLQVQPLPDNLPATVIQGASVK